MTIEFDDNGKFFTDIVSKAPVPVVIQTVTNRIHGNIHVGRDLPLKIVRQQISSAVDVIVQMSRLRDGARMITAVTEVAGMEGEVIVLSDIFKFNQTGVDADDKAIGQHKATGIRPLFGPRLEAAGFKLGADIFGATAADMAMAHTRR